MDSVEWILEEEEKPYNIRHRCFQFARKVIMLVTEFKYPFVLRSLFDQLIRSSTSIGANAVEGSSGSSKKDFINFYSIALKSANETKYWLCLIRDTTNCNKEEINGLLKEADELSKIIASIIRAAKI
jgi:four helix bundle protein